MLRPLFDYLRTLRGSSEAARQARQWLAQRGSAVLISATIPLSLNTLPMIVLLLSKQWSMNAEQIAAFAASEMMGLAAGSLLGAAVMTRLSPRATARASVALILIADIASALATTPTLLIALRAASGAGIGIARGAIAYVLGMRDRESNAGLNLVAITIVTIAVLVSFPLLHPNLMFVFFLLAALLLPCVFLAGFFPQEYLAPQAAVGAHNQTDPGRPVALRAILGLGNSASAALARGVFWTFLGAIAAAAGVPDWAPQLAMPVGSALTFVAALIVMSLGKRITQPVTIVFAALAAVTGLLATSEGNGWLYVTALCLWYFALPFDGGATAGYMMRYAPYKRYAVHLASASNVVLPLGPLFGAQIAKHYGYGALTWTAVGLTCAAALFLWGYVLLSKVSVSADVPVAGNL